MSNDNKNAAALPLDVELAQDRLTELRKLERDVLDSLPAVYYMDPPDGGNVSLGEQVKRMAEDAALWRKHSNTPAAPGIDLAPRPMATAPRDGTMLRLLVRFDDHATEDTEGPAWTIGACNDDNVHQDEGAGWQFACWCWDHDHFTEGKGTPVGWLPLIDASPKGGSTDENNDLLPELRDVEDYFTSVDPNPIHLATVRQAINVIVGSLKGGSDAAWREGWALAYSGPSNLYGDDGELQDNSSIPCIDWRRDSAEVIRDKITERGNRLIAATQATSAEVGE